MISVSSARERPARVPLLHRRLVRSRAGRASGTRRLGLLHRPPVELGCAGARGVWQGSGCACEGHGISGGGGGSRRAPRGRERPRVLRQPVARRESCEESHGVARARLRQGGPSHPRVLCSASTLACARRRSSSGGNGSGVTTATRGTSGRTPWRRRGRAKQERSSRHLDAERASHDGGPALLRARVTLRLAKEAAQSRSRRLAHEKCTIRRTGRPQGEHRRRGGRGRPERAAGRGRASQRYCSAAQGVAQAVARRRGVALLLRGRADRLWRSPRAARGRHRVRRDRAVPDPEASGRTREDRSP